MKFYKISIISLGAVALSFLYMSCYKSNIKMVSAANTDFTSKALVQVYNGTLLSLRNYVYVDGNAVTGAPLVYGATFPSTPANFSATSGIRAFLIRDTSSTILTQPIMSFSESLAPNKYYTLFMYDTVTTPKQKIVTNDIIIPADTTARLRFANFIYNPGVPAGSSLSSFDIFSVKRSANIFTNVQLTDVTGYIPYASALTDTFYIRTTGSTTNLQNFVPSTTSPPGVFVNIQAILTPTQKRSYTLIFRGGYRATVTTNSTLRALSIFSNN